RCPTTLSPANGKPPSSNCAVGNVSNAGPASRTAHRQFTVRCRMTTEREQQTTVASMCCGSCGKVISKETTLSGILDFVASAEAAGLDVQREGVRMLPRVLEAGGLSRRPPPL